MGTDPNAAGDALERMLSREPVDDEWRDVARFVDELQEAVPTSDLASEDLHVAAMVESSQASGLPKQRRKPMKKKVVARILAPIAAAFVVLGGMAYAGALPWSAQEPASTSTLSPGDEDSQGAVGEDDQGENTQDDVEAPEQGENDDNQGDNDDQGEDAQGESSDESTSSDDQGDNDDQGEDAQGESSDESTSSDDQGDGGSDESSGDQQGDSQD